MSFFGFHPLIERWFQSRFAEPTAPQRLGWPHIEQGENTLIAAPTGSGKTLTAFLAVIDRLLKESIAGKLENGVRAIYVSPLRALSNDMHRNLSEPLEELNALAAAEFPDVPIASLRVGLRTGDSTPSQRAALVRKPPHIVVTTPESLFLLLTAEKGRAALKSVDTIIVDEIHALVRDKRGSHLALTIERLESLCERPLQRIGLSATQKPIERIAEFLVGSRSARRPEQAPETFNHEEAACSIVDVGYSRDLDLKIEVPPSDLSAVCSTEQWGEINERIVELINAHRSTLIFVNTRRMAERVTHQLSEILGDDQVGSHHGSLSSAIRLKTEQQLKGGELKAVVATASLELGLDVGFIDLVIQIGSPRAIATFLQRVGRSGHSLGKTPKGRLFALTRDELVESMGLIRAIRAGRLDVIPIPECPIDVLAQQIVAEVACREWSTGELFDLFRRAWPFRDLKREDFDETLRFLSEGLTDRSGRGKVYLHQDLVQKRLRTRPGARIVATSNAGAIPEVAEFRVVAQPDGVVVGTLDEDFAMESHAGQIILLGNTSWRMEGVHGTDVHVTDAGGVPPTVPFWRGEAPGRTLELSEEVSRLREELEAKLKALPETVIASWWEDAAAGAESSGEASEAILPATQTEFRNSTADIVKWLVQETDCSDYAGRQVVNYLAAQIAAVGIVPTQKRVIFERFFDESGGMQMVVHAPFGSRVTQAWGLSMRKRFCVSFDFELQATADDDGFILSLGPQHSFPLESMFPMLTSENAQRLLEQAILYIPMFQIRWRWNANRALLVPRRDKGKRIPPALQRFRADDLLSSVFPLLTGCQENVVGELKLPDHILLRQTMQDCLREALDIDGLVDVLRRVEAGEIEFVARDTRESSPFSYELLNSNPYAFLDGGELPERRARAVSTRRSLTVDSVSDLGRLDPLAIEQVTGEATPLVRNTDELHDVLLTRIVVPDDEMEDWRGWLEELVQQRRATSTTATGGVTVWTAAERIPAVRAMFPDSKLDPEIQVPDGVRLEWNDVDGRVAAMRGLLETSGPLTHEEAAKRTGTKSNQAFAALEALEGEGVVLRGKFRESSVTAGRAQWHPVVCTYARIAVGVVSSSTAFSHSPFNDAGVAAADSASIAGSVPAISDAPSRADVEDSPSGCQRPVRSRFSATGLRPGGCLLGT
jgi:ATP-dependent helicase Lhr and Lhr-like helicase